MFDRTQAKHKQSTAAAADIGKSSSLDGSSSHAGPTPFHRRKSYIPRDLKEYRPKFKWHIYDNRGSYNGWFDWLPEWMRVGYWSPVAVLFLVAFYYGMYLYKPTPLRFATTRADDLGWWADCAIFLWGITVVVKARMDMGAISGFYISYTGWSWAILTARAGLEATARIIEPTLPHLAAKMAVWGSSLRFPAAVAAFITFTIWNLVLFPIIYFKSMPPGEKRQNFLKFNFGFFMTNIHGLNLPMAMINNVFGSSVRLFTESDLYVGYLVVALYSALYLFVMDRIGLHFYPIFCPRSATCALSFGGVLYLYWYLMQKGNEIILYLNPDLEF